LAALNLLAAPVAHASGAVSICDEASLTGALAGGGLVTFTCSGTITLTATIAIGSDTTIDGTGQSVTISGGNNVRIFSINEGVTFNLQKLTVANGVCDDYIGCNGGGIYNDNGTVHVTNSAFTANTASSGGGIYNEHAGALTVTNSTFSGNHAGLGGGIYSEGTLTVTNSTFSGNTTTGGSGGGIYSQGTLSVTHTLFSTNSAASGGGGISSTSALTVTNSTFSANSATNGGGLDVEGGRVVIRSSTFADNHSSPSSGGGLYHYSGAVYVTNSTFSGNSAGSTGGGISILNGTVTVANSTFAGNHASNGGGFYNSSGTLTIQNSIIARSTAGGNCYGGVQGTNNLADDNNCGGGATNSPSILVGLLGDYGGDTMTVPLLPGSAAIDAGDEAVCTSATGDPTYGAGGLDQRGIARPAGKCDIGAFEARGFALAVFSGDNQTTDVNTAFAQPLVVAASSAFSEPVDGGKVTFTPPASGASAVMTGNPATIGAVTSGRASITATANSSIGPYTVTVSAVGVATGASFTLRNKGTTTTTLTSFPNPAPVGAAVTFTATMAAAVSGTVAFADNGVTLAGCTAQTTASSQATCTTSALAAGMHRITAIYSGDANYHASTSSIFLEGVYARPAVDADSGHSCGLKADGAAACWGAGTQSIVPAPNATWVQVSAGNSHTCGLKGDGTLTCWGYNSFGQLNVPSNPGWVQVSAGGSHTCGVETDGSLHCWGANSYGQTDVPPPNTDWVQVSGGYVHTCGLKADGALACWGSNTYGQRDVPGTTSPWVQVNASREATCGLKADGSLSCWGENSHGETNVPTPNTNWVQVSGGDEHTCGLKADGTIVCWGATSGGESTVPAPNANWVQVSAGRLHTCGVKGDGSFRCWGDNSEGQAPVLTLAPTTLPNPTPGVPYSQTMTAGGGATPYTFAVSAGAAPPGLTLNAAGTWSGTYTTGGIFTFTVLGRDARNIGITRAYTMTAVVSTTTTLASSANPTVAGASITFTATVTLTAMAAPTATGTIRFYADGAPLGAAVTLSSGAAVANSSALAVGSHVITATYSGDAAHLSSTGRLSPNQQVCGNAITVTNANDDGAASLRRAIADLCPGGTVHFAGDYTIGLGSALAITKNMTIDGLGHSVVISGNHAVLIFAVGSGAAANLQNLKIADGKIESENGAGIRNNGTLTVTNCAVTGNLADNGGGIYNIGALKVTNSAFSGNSASSVGGGIFNNLGGTLTVTNSTFSANSAFLGGGIANASSGTLNVTNSTFSGNSATFGSGGIRNDGTLTVKNTIIANSTGPNCSGTVGDGGGNLQYGGTTANSCGATILTADPQLGPLADHGGPTLTMALGPGSPAIDAGNSANCPATDQRSQARSDLACDIGAYELKPADSPTVVRAVGSAITTTFGSVLLGIRRDGGLTNPGVITVTRSVTGTSGLQAIGARWAITPTATSGFSLTLQLCYTNTELGTLTEADLRFWRYSSGVWTMLPTAPTLSTVNGNHCATLSGIVKLSTWTLATAEPTAVTVQIFAARPPSRSLAHLLLCLLSTLCDP
jgi:predicted outer membrane repeat protein